jgi:hypothetical protein
VRWLLEQALEAIGTVRTLDLTPAETAAARCPRKGLQRGAPVTGAERHRPPAVDPVTLDGRRPRGPGSLEARGPVSAAMPVARRFAAAPWGLSVTDGRGAPESRLSLAARCAFGVAAAAPRRMRGWKGRAF